MYCLREPRFSVAFVLTLVQALLRGIFDATVTTEAQAIFYFFAQIVGLFVFTLLMPQILLGHIVGSTVDKHGTRMVAAIGLALLIPCLACLGLPFLRLIIDDVNVVVFCVVLLLYNVGLSMVGIPVFVKAINVTQRYEIILDSLASMDHTRNYMVSIVPFSLLASPLAPFWVASSVPALGTE